jgi:hypothetical protein
MAQIPQLHLIYYFNLRYAYGVKRKDSKAHTNLLQLSQICTIQMPHRPSQFRLTVVKPYYKDNSSEPLQDVLKDVPENALEDIPEDILEENHDQHALEGDYNSNTIVVDVPQL